MKRLSNLFPRNSLVTIYKSFIRPLLDYYDVIYYQPNNESYSNKLNNKIQCCSFYNWYNKKNITN